MEQHPVPRNISGFQFHLIGDMTLRQFGYLATGVITGYIVFRIGLFPGIFNMALAVCCALIGFAFAFVPIQDRPLEKWIVAFIKSVLSPTQYLWRKDNIPPLVLIQPVALRRQIETTPQLNTHKEAQLKLKTYLATLPTLPHETMNVAEKQYIQKTMNLFQTQAVASVGQPQEEIHFKPVPTVTISSTVPPVSPSLIPQPTPVATAQPKPISPQPVVQPAITLHPKIPIVADTSQHPVSQITQEQVRKLTEEKAFLEKELSGLRVSLSKQKESMIVKPAPAQETAEPTVKTINPKQAVSQVGMPRLPGYPNIVIGVVKDPNLRLLPNIIITIKDKKGMPLRALKTNKLGQFATATPLSDGTYLLELEDPLKRYLFDIPEITLNGKIFLPIEIMAKGQKELMREQLSKELFGGLAA